MLALEHKPDMDWRDRCYVELIYSKERDQRGWHLRLRCEREYIVMPGSLDRIWQLRKPDDYWPYRLVIRLRFNDLHRVRPRVIRSWRDDLIVPADHVLETMAFLS